MKKRNDDDYDIEDLMSFDTSPVITHEYKRFVHHVYIHEGIEAPSKYRKVLDVLQRSGPEDVVIFHINSYGGMVITAAEIINGIRGTMAYTKAIIHMDCASAATLITLNVDEVVVTPTSTMLLHAASFGTYDYVGRVEDMVKHVSESMRVLMRETYEGFVTATELEEMNKGKELWMDSEEILRRLEQRKTYFEMKEKGELPPPPKKAPRRKSNAKS